MTHRYTAPLALALLTPATLAWAQGASAATPATDPAWRHCAAQPDSAARLACFDQWAGQQAWQAPPAQASATPAGVPSTTPASAQPSALNSATALDSAQAAPEPTVVHIDGCRNPRYSEMSRQWELESGSDCGTFRFRGYRPMSVSVVGADSVNRQPTSSAPGHSAETATPYRRTEMRVQLSVRTKMAQGLLTAGDAERKDSLWFGYTQQSYWQLFSPGISRPFRATDHEPEVIYVYPTDAQLPGGWRLRYSGVGLVHQSNGQSLPLSRSWNRAYLMAGMELGQRWNVQARIWKRLNEKTTSDDNPGISDYIGRGELRVFWNINPENTVGVTVRHALASKGRGSARVEWLQTLGTGLWGSKSNLRLHTQLFSGYGDSLIDYNRQRTVFSVGLSLLDF